jgi:hypothetical protein
MADKASLQLIGLVLASVTASIILVASMMVYSWAGGRLIDHHQAKTQIEQTAMAHRT